LFAEVSDEVKGTDEATEAYRNSLIKVAS